MFILWRLVDLVTFFQGEEGMWLTTQSLISALQHYTAHMTIWEVCGRLHFTGYQDLKSQDLHSLIAAAVADCILTGQLDQYILQNFLLQVGFMEFDIDGYNSMLPACALQNIIYFCGIWYYRLVITLIILQESVIFSIIICPCLIRTGNYQIREFDWLKRILTAV